MNQWSRFLVNPQAEQFQLRIMSSMLNGAATHIKRLHSSKVLTGQRQGFGEKRWIRQTLRLHLWTKALMEMLSVCSFIIFMVKNKTIEEVRKTISCMLNVSGNSPPLREISFCVKWIRITAAFLLMLQFKLSLTVKEYRMRFVCLFIDPLITAQHLLSKSLCLQEEAAAV